MIARIKNWKQFQHFKDRRPPWIKLYRDLMDDIDWHELSGDDAKALVMLWLLASEDETQQGQLPDLKTIAFRLRKNEEETKQALNRLSHWVVQDDIEMISSRYQDGPPETETETEAEEDTSLRSVVIESPKEEIGKYEFESGVIRLNKKDFEKWKDSFPNLDLRAELMALAQWAAQYGDKWFFPVSGALAKRNREQAVKLEQARSGGADKRHTLSDPHAGII